MSKYEGALNAWGYEIKRVALTLAAIAACFYPDWEALRTTLFIAGVFLSVALISHFVRKYALFPYIDMRRYAQKALEEPLAAAVVFAAVTSVILVSITTAATFFSK